MFHSFYISSGITFLLLEAFPSVFPLVWICWWQILSTFFLKSLFTPLFLKNTFLGYKVLGQQVFLSTFKKYHCILSPVVWLIISCHCNVAFLKLIWIVSPYHPAIFRIMLSSVFRSFTIMCLEILTCLKSAWLKSVHGCLSSSLRNYHLGILCSNIASVTCLSFLFFWDSNLS